VNGNNKRLKLKTFRTINEIAESSINSAINFKIPLYIVHGKEDSFALSDGSSKFYEKTPISDKVFILRDGIFI
jgi:hypothetical protein